MGGLDCCPSGGQGLLPQCQAEAARCAEPLHVGAENRCSGSAPCAQGRDGTVELRLQLLSCSYANEPHRNDIVWNAVFRQMYRLVQRMVAVDRCKVASTIAELQL